MPVNLGTCMEITIRALVELIARLSGLDGEIRWDPSTSDGQLPRYLDASRAEELLDVEAEVDFETGLKRTIAWYQENQPRITAAETVI